jgi:DNA invertase Pin-like site-specific DNA recombinase
MKVALYARVSSDSQAQRGTISSQLEALQASMASSGHEVVAVYTDDGYSGARLDRPGLDALRDAAIAGAFEAVWCLSPDRLARSFAYQVLVTDELARLGVDVCFTDTPPIADDPQARLLVQVQGLFAEYERAKLSERVRRGKLYRVRAGEAVFPRVAYGYRRVPRSAAGPARLEIYEPEATVVRRMFDEYASGTSMRQIARHLYHDGVPSPDGKEVWPVATIAHLLRNPAYAGTAAWYRYDYVPAPELKRARKIRRPREDWVEVPVPAIVTAEVFATAQAIVTDNSRFSTRNTPPETFLLRGQEDPLLRLPQPRPDQGRRAPASLHRTPHPGRRARRVRLRPDQSGAAATPAAPRRRGSPGWSRRRPRRRAAGRAARTHRQADRTGPGRAATPRRPLPSRPDHPARAATPGEGDNHTARSAREPTDRTPKPPSRARRGQPDPQAYSQLRRPRC